MICCYRYDIKPNLEGDFTRIPIQIFNRDRQHVNHTQLDSGAATVISPKSCPPSENTDRTRAEEPSNSMI